MSAGKEISLISEIPKLGIIAGSGVIPRQLDQACQELKIPTYIVGIKGSTDEATPDFWSRVGTSGKTIQWLQENDVRDIVMIGAVKRPGLFDLWPDWVTFKFFLKAWIKSFGDLINIKRLVKIVPEENSPLLGALIEKAVECGAHSRLKAVANQCKRAGTGEFLFHLAKDKPTLALEAMESATALNERWNVYWKTIEAKTDMIYNRTAVLKANPILMYRALFGVIIRADIIVFLKYHKRVNISKLAEYFMMDFAVVSREISGRRCWRQLSTHYN